MATRKMLVEAKSQQRPEERWLVMGPPSKGILTLKIWGLERVVSVDVRIVLGLALLKAESASLGE